MERDMEHQVDGAKGSRYSRKDVDRQIVSPVSTPLQQSPPYYGAYAGPMQDQGYHPNYQYTQRQPYYQQPYIQPYYPGYAPPPPPPRPSGRYDPMNRLGPLMVFLVFILIFVVTTIISIPVMVWAFVKFDTIDQIFNFLADPLMVLVLLIIQDTVFVIIPYFIYVRTELLTWTELGVETEGLFSRALIGFVTGICLSGGVIGIVMIIGYDTSGGVPMLEKMTFTDYLLLLIGGSIVAPIAEEFFFRGICFHGIKKYLEYKNNAHSFLLSFLFSSILFAAVHFYDPFGTVIVFIAGMIFALLLYKTDSLIPAFLAHGTYNAMVITATYMGYI